MRPAVIGAAVALLVTGAAVAIVEPFGDDGIEPTGETVEVRAWVETHQQDVFPLFRGELWAFCMEPLPGSEGAVEYHGTGEPCSVPGPTLRVDQGDRVRVHFENPHDFPHTIHWHGQTVPYREDGVPGVTQDTVTTGEDHTYEFLAEREGTLLYHCHVDTKHHVLMGLYGAFIVESQDPVDVVEDVDVERTLMLGHGNQTHQFAPLGDGHAHGHGGGHDGDGGGHQSGTPGEQNDAFTPELDLFTINGRSYPLTLEDEGAHVDVEEGDRVRIRFANPGFRTETMHLHGHDMLVTHKDGLPLGPEARFEADTLRIAPGERYDVVVEANNPGSWVLHTHVSGHVTNSGQYPGGMLTRMVYDGFENVSLAAEAPGGMPPVPGFHRGDHGGPVQELAIDGNLSGADHTATGSIPVYSERAARMELTLTLDATTPADEIEATVSTPRGEDLATLTANGMEPEAQATAENLPARGPYEVDLQGQGAGATYQVEAKVVYPVYEIGG